MAVTIRQAFILDVMEMAKASTVMLEVAKDHPCDVARTKLRAAAWKLAQRACASAEARQFGRMQQALKAFSEMDYDGAIRQMAPVASNFGN